MATKKPKQEGVPVPTVVIVAIVLFVAGLLIGKFTLTSKSECEEAACPQETVRYRIYPRGNNPSKGPDNAKVTVVQVTDFRNARAKQAWETLQKIQKKYAKAMRLVLVNNPGSADARKAAIAALAANKQGKFWEIHEKLFGFRGKLTDAALEKMAKSAGLNIEKFKEDMKERRISSLVAFDQRQVRRLGVQQVPAVFINGRYVSGKISADKVEKIVKEEIKAAEKLLAEMDKKGGKKGRRGGRAPNVYREFMRTARTSLSDTGDKADRGRGKKRDKRKKPQEDPNAVYKVSVEGKPWKGTKNALITIVEVSEFQCGFCKRVNPTLEKIMKEYGGKVKIVFSHNPLGFHKQAMPAAIASHEVFKQKGPEAFWKFHDKLFENQPKIKTEGRKLFESIAKEMGGINMTKFKKALDEKTHKDEIVKMQRETLALGARGTPTFFINGRKLRGARPFPSFKQLIDEELKKAEAAVKEGKATKANYYASIMEKGLSRVKYLPGTGPDKRKPRERKIVDPDVVFKMPIEGKPAKGAKHGIVTIVVSNSFQCPFSGRVAKTLDKIIEEYGEKVKLVYHNNALPFQKQAMIAAEAAHEAFVQKGDKGFWEYHDKLYGNQPEIRKSGREFLEKVAKEVGLNMTKFKKALDENTHKELLENQRKLAVQLGARGTPGCFINGKIFTGARPYEAFKQRVEQAIKEAEPLVGKAGGVKKLYDYIIKDGKTSAVYKTVGGGGAGRGRGRRPGGRGRRRPNPAIRRGALPKGVRPNIKRLRPRRPPTPPARPAAE